MEIIATLLLLAFLFLCGLFNTLIFPHSKLLPHLRSLFFSKTASTADYTKKKTEQSDLPANFSSFDTDTDGFTTKEEISESISGPGSEVISNMEEVDADAGSLINLRKFKDIYFGADGDEKWEDEEEDRNLRFAFMALDDDADGLMRVKNLSSVLEVLGMKQGESEEKCKEMIKRVDFDGHGMLNFEEFKKMLLVKKASFYHNERMEGLHKPTYFEQELVMKSAKLPKFYGSC